MGLTAVRHLPRPHRGAATLAALLLLWEIGIRAFALRSPLAPSVVDVALCAWRLARNGDLFVFYGLSLLRVAAGFAAGAALGFTLGALLGLYRLAERILDPIFAALRQIPIFGLIPLFGLWFGTGELSKFVMTATAAFYPLLMHVHDGLAGTPPAYRDVGRVLCFSRWTLLRRVLLPGAAPAILTGLKHSLSYAWIASVGAELFMPGNPGLGTMLALGRTELRMDYVLLGIALVGVSGHWMSAGLSRLIDRLAPWQVPAPGAGSPRQSIFSSVFRRKGATRDHHQTRHTPQQPLADRA